MRTQFKTEFTGGVVAATNYPAPPAVALGEGAGPLSVQDRAQLAECEGIIRKGLETFIEVGGALMTIKERKLYRETHGTFEAYCRKVLDLTDRRARQLMTATEVTYNLKGAKDVAPGQLDGQKGNHGSDPQPTAAILPRSERQVRPLASLPKEEQKPAWDKAVDIAKGAQPTAKDVEAAVQSLRPKVQSQEPSGTYVVCRVGAMGRKFYMTDGLGWAEDPNKAAEFSTQVSALTTATRKKAVTVLRSAALEWWQEAQTVKRPITGETSKWPKPDSRGNYPESAATRYEHKSKGVYAKLLVLEIHPNQWIWASSYNFRSGDMRAGGSSLRSPRDTDGFRKTMELARRMAVSELSSCCADVLKGLNSCVNKTQKVAARKLSCWLVENVLKEGPEQEIKQNRGDSEKKERKANNRKSACSLVGEAIQTMRRVEDLLDSKPVWRSLCNGALAQMRKLERCLQ